MRCTLKIKPSSPLYRLSITQETTNKAFAPLNPDKVTSAQPYNSTAAPRRRKLPKPPSPEKQRSRDFIQVKERYYEPDGEPTPQSSSRDQFQAYSGAFMKRGGWRSVKMRCRPPFTNVSLTHSLRTPPFSSWIAISRPVR